MIYPSIAELSDQGVNRYMLSIATAKCARKITEEAAANQTPDAAKDDKYNQKKSSSDGKPVRKAIEKLYTREYRVFLDGVTAEEEPPVEELTEEVAETEAAKDVDQVCEAAENDTADEAEETAKEDATEESKN